MYYPQRPRARRWRAALARRTSFVGAWFRVPRRYAPVGVACLVGWLSASPAVAGPIGPGSGGGKRAIARSALQGKAVASSPTAEGFDHKQGAPPKQPSTRLPKGASPQAEDVFARAQVAGGVPSGQPRRVADPELSALRAADKVLFPRTLEGFEPGWSWGDADPSVQADGLPPVTRALPSAKLDGAADAEWLMSLALPDFPVRLDARVVEYLRFYRDSERGQAIARAWARKVGRYAPAMRAEFVKAGLPQDIVWLSLIESGHNPTIASPAGAAGLWQFIPETARMYGLTVDRWVDERLDPQRSTRAAAAFLGDLYQRFGTWELAMAAYNMGHGGLLRAVRKYNTNDFWKLSRYEAGLPWETSLYVPKVFAIAIVMNNLRAFGLDDIEPDPPVAFDTVYVDSSVPLEDVARASGIAVESLRTMNPQYRSERLPPSADTEKDKTRWAVKVPPGQGKKAASRLMKAEYKQRYETYVVRFGDTLDGIALRLGTESATLENLNGLLPNSRVEPGAVLMVPRIAKGRFEPDVEELVVVPQRRFKVPGRKRIFYRALKGDTLAEVARVLDVTPAELVLWNELDEEAKLQGGMVLQAFVPKHADLSQVRSVSSKHTRIFEVGTLEFLSHVESLNGRKRLVVKARAGDTLAKIGRRYGLGVGMMERINRCSRTRKLEAGDEVVVYAKGQPAKQAESNRSERRGRPLAKLDPPAPRALPPRGR